MIWLQARIVTGGIKEQIEQYQVKCALYRRNSERNLDVDLNQKRRKDSHK